MPCRFIPTRRLPSVICLVATAIPLLSAAELPEKLTRDCEVAVARSALPKRLREGASIYVLDKDRFDIAVKGSGPFTCIVERNHRNAIIPQCMDHAGVDSLLPAIIDRSLMALSGMQLDAINMQQEQTAQDGEYRAPSRAGISYMMSDFNYIYVESTARVMKVAPHVMYYAPNLSNDDVGGSLRGATENIGTPFVLNEGLHGMMIVYTEHEADPDEVALACRGQLGEPPPSFNPFPVG